MIIDLMERELRRDEGVRRNPYLDTKKVLSVGVGHNLVAHPLPAGWTYPLSDAQINALLLSDINDVLAQLDKFAPWWRQLDEVRQRVVANMTFNLGTRGFLNFKKAVAAMRAGDYLTASLQMKDSSWYSQVGDRAVRLCAAMRTGVMPL